MGLATNILVLVLPVTLANQVVYLPLNYYVPVPVSALPHPVVYNQIPLPHGNRHHEPVQKTTYHGSCQEVTNNWQEWDTGAAANVRIKRPAASSVGGEWEVELVFDRPVASLKVYNGEASEHSGTNFKVKPTAWSARSAEEKETVNFSLKAEYDPLQKRPSLEAVVVDGYRHECKPGVPDAVTKGVRLAAHAKWPSKILGLYILLADDTEKGFESKADWEPQLFDWQQEAANVLFFTFIHPDTMEVPPTFQKLAASRGTGQPGAVPKDTVIIFAIGGYEYSLRPNPWHWLTSKEAAIKMAEEVALWPDQYGCDGIDLDLEEGAGSRPEAGPNMIHFIRRLKELNPNIIVSQPVYGYPQVQAETDVINASWDKKGNHQGLADAIGLMVYEGTQALQYVKNYANGSGQWEGFPIKVNAPKSTILLGAKGSSSASTLTQLANAAVQDDILGIMVWYASVKNGFDYAPVWDASTSSDSINGYKQAMQIFKKAMSAGKGIDTSSSDPAMEEKAAEHVAGKKVEQDDDIVLVGEEKF